MTRVTKRSTALLELMDFLAAAGRPVKAIEIAERFGRHRATVYRMIQELAAELDVNVQQGPDGYWIDAKDHTFRVNLRLHEVMAVFLASRLLAHYSDKPNPHASSALARLSIALQRTAPRIAAHMARTADRLDRPLTEAERVYLTVLETLTQAWAEGRRVRLVTQEGAPHGRLFEPYFIEPSSVGFSSYVIGFDHHRQAIRTFKIERLRAVVSTLETYTIPESFDPYERLEAAWGVNWGDGGTPIEVVVRFAPGRVTERVCESHWHPTQRIELQADGSAIFRVTVGSTLDMKWWLRQWGPDCVVLAPAELRREIADDMRQAAQLYAKASEEEG
ncbi:MAG: WYL domain-containing protein [Thermoflexales bacterium]|nr:WYL domain-containing protein [Thermoflexales bacterium]